MKTMIAGYFVVNQDRACPRIASVDRLNRTHLVGETGSKREPAHQREVLEILLLALWKARSSR